MGYDIETRFSKPEVDASGLLLSAFCNNDEDVLVIDNTSVNNNEVFTPEVLKRCLFVCHNSDYEARWGVATGFLPQRFGCTMVNDKRLLAGQTGYHFDLISVINRRLGGAAVPIWMEKDIRNEFKDTEVFHDYHILYNAADVIRLKPVYFSQLEEAERLGQLYLHQTINSRIITPIAGAEITGIRHDSDKWTQITRDREKRANELCAQLDQLIVEKYGLTPGMINPEVKKQLQQQTKKVCTAEARTVKLKAQEEKLRLANKTHQKQYQITLEQLKKVTEVVAAPRLEEAGGSVNWGSWQQVLKVFSLIGCPAPEAKDKETHQMKDGTSKEARANWFVKYPDSPFMDVMKLFDSFKKVEHNIKAFGDNWIRQYVRNGRAYTLLDQAGADTGRFTSGDKKPPGVLKEYAQMQQIPGRGEDTVYRDCFLADPGRKLIIADYKNCEGVIMGSLGRDLNVIRISTLPDQHSYLGTLAWRAAYAKRYERTKDPKDLELSLTYEMNQSTPQKKEERTKFKNSGGLFPVAYGVSPNKIAAAAGITESEAAAMRNAIAEQIPDAIKALDAKAKHASTYGYVIHNERTGSRRWFSTVLDHIHYKFPISKGDIIEVEMQARNSPIQGRIVPWLNQVNCWKLLTGQSAAKPNLG